jgi:hypothetical protein
MHVPLQISNVDRVAVAASLAVGSRNIQSMEKRRVTLFRFTAQQKAAVLEHQLPQAKELAATTLSSRINLSAAACCTMLMPFFRPTFAYTEA